MAVRTSMAALIAFTRTKIFDTGGTPVFTDQNVQDQLDLRRTDVRYVSLLPGPTFVPGPSVLYLDFYSAVQYWEDDYVITDLTYADITSQLTLREPLVGHFAFPTQPNGIAVRLTGKYYDVYGSSADLLENWAMTLKLNYRFSSDNQHFAFEQQVANLMALAKRYRALSQPRSMRMIQSDENADQDGGGVTYPNLGAGSEFI